MLIQVLFLSLSYGFNVAVAAGSSIVVPVCTVCFIFLLVFKRHVDHKLLILVFTHFSALNYVIFETEYQAMTQHMIFFVCLQQYVKWYLLIMCICIIHFTFILVIQAFDKAISVVCREKVKLQVYPHHCFLLCIHTMPTLQGFKFSFIHDFRKDFILENSSIFLEWAAQKYKICLSDSFTSTFRWDLIKQVFKKIHLLKSRMRKLILLYSLS